MDQHEQQSDGNASAERTAAYDGAPIPIRTGRGKIVSSTPALRMRNAGHTVAQRSLEHLSPAIMQEANDTEAEQECSNGTA